MTLMRLLCALLLRLPHERRVRVCAAGMRGIFGSLPRFRAVARRNLEIAFPDLTVTEREAIRARSYESLGRLFADFVRMPTLDAAWVQEHVSCPELSRYAEAKRRDPSKGILLATGHLGSFELLAHCMALWGHPISFIVRNMKLPRLDAWINARREARGNRFIARKGAVREMLSELATGRDVGVLFDQNVTRNHAVFVPWFGRQAATTRSLGATALRTRAFIYVASLRYVGNDRYVVDATGWDFTALYDDPQLTNEQKIEQITRQLSAEFERMIRLSPESWFWMHRRWKTTPEGVVEDVY